MLRLSKYFLILVMVLVLLVTVNTGCKTNEDTNGADETTRQKIEQTAAYTAATVADLGGKIFGSAIGITGVGAESESADAVMNDFSYDPNTGWWSFSINLDNGQSAAINVRFLNASGNFHQFFSRSTDRIETNGQGSGSEGSFTYDFTITGVSPSSGTYTINGSGTTTYEGTTTSWTVDNMTFNKAEDEYPENGSLVIIIEGVTITITWNGNQTVQVTYIYKGLTYTFTINLETGQIT